MYFATFLVLIIILLNEKILHPEAQDFINQHLLDDLNKVALKGIGISGISDREILEQIQSKKKAKNKLPIWFDTPGIYFPSKVSMEQTSSAKTAKYKASIIDGESIIDLTGGFGVDSYFFSQKTKSVIHCEIKQELSAIVKHNFTVLKCEDVFCFSGDGMDYFLAKPHKKFNWIYLDPARRDDVDKKVFLLEDTTPNILELQEQLYNHSNNILLKTSPLLDLSLGIKRLKNVSEIHIVGIKNEVKELLWVIRKDYKGDPAIKTINFGSKGKQVFDFHFGKPAEETKNYSLPQKHLYEPNACIMKSGGFDSLIQSLNLTSLKKLHANSHLFTSKSLIEFPGRAFEIIDITPYQKKKIKRKYAKQKHNITTRNFPMKVSIIRKEFQIKDGGDSYLFFTTDMNERLIVVEGRKI